MDTFIKLIQNLVDAINRVADALGNPSNVAPSPSENNSAPAEEKKKPGRPPGSKKAADESPAVDEAGLRKEINDAVKALISPDKGAKHGPSIRTILIENGAKADKPTIADIPVANLQTTLDAVKALTGGAESFDFC